MQKRYGRIAGWGAYVPETIVTNYDLEKRLDTSHEWIVQRSGIHQRRIAAPNETTSAMAMRASQRALEQANLSARDLDLIIVATSTPDYLTPPISSQIQHGLGAADTPGFVLVNGCAGFVYALCTAHQFIASGVYQNILIIGVELLSRHLNWQDRSTCVLFGDAAGAVVMQASERPGGVLGFAWGSDGSQGQHIIVPAGGTVEPFNADALASGRHLIHMNGREVFKFATRVIGPASQRAVVQAGLTLDDVDWIIPHQANLRIIEAAARNMELPMERFIVNINKYANTSAASIPLALSEALNEGRIGLEDTLLLVTFGAGLTWAAAVVQLSK